MIITFNKYENVYYTYNSQYFVSIFGQTELLKIKSEGKEIEGEFKYNDYGIQFCQNYNQYKEILSLFLNHPIEYYGLDKKYDSDFKKEMFKGTDEYKKIISEFLKKKDELLYSTYYLNYQLRTSVNIYYVNFLKYDLKLKNFGFRNDGTTKISLKNYIKIGCIYISVPKNVTSVISKTVPNIQNIQFLITDKTKTLEIEQNRNNIRIIFVFKFLKCIEEKCCTQHSLRRSLNCDGYCFITDLEKMIVYNEKTLKIYKEYFPRNK